MKAALLALLIATPALAGDLVYRQGKDSIRLTDEACPVSVVKHIPEGVRGYFRRAYAAVNGRQFTACHATINKTLVHIYYEDADEGVVPIALFKEDLGV